MDAERLKSIAENAERALQDENPQLALWYMGLFVEHVLEAVRNAERVEGEQSIGFRSE